VIHRRWISAGEAALQGRAYQGCDHSSDVTLQPDDGIRVALECLRPIHLPGCTIDQVGGDHEVLPIPADAAINDQLRVDVFRYGYRIVSGRFRA
jgi:hypothetical protein